MISDRWEEITSRVVKQVRHDPKMLELGEFPESELRARCSEILQNLDTSLVSPEAEFGKRFERIGRIRFEEGVPLHEIVHAYQIIRNNMIQYVRDQGIGSGALEIYAEKELQSGADRMFDTMIYYLVRGYEQAMRERLGRTAMA
jgi:hypothetical protein